MKVSFLFLRRYPFTVDGLATAPIALRLAILPARTSGAFEQGGSRRPLSRATCKYVSFAVCSLARSRSRREPDIGAFLVDLNVWPFFLERPRVVSRGLQ